MIFATFTAADYAPKFVRARYVRRNALGDDEYSWCEVGDDRRYDLRQGGCHADDLPDDIRAAADMLRGHAFGFVPWPQED